ncbi:hypothetical protein RFEPED_0008 [Rickettsia felis str. Pedreira]|uniref:Lipoprotein n=2 Tax=spotted fever group TaxID=114277 RepID=A0A0F3MQE0_RICFI|nr:MULTISPECIES: hypothetical protein [Rickettsia]KJV80838.1 hypothetical protein RHORCCE3_0016 [Rickettsia hoogstraalii str. RCCE3]KHO02981.1 hypothetical protein JS55_04360 [Rickettsia felis str. LSU]KHO03641.1 hypothetical protein JS61_04205 [Rickettsia felis]KJV57642.1 hypothetical protein RFEPED_0008 [Rickettsia felis str. Pedreira]MDE8611354.1 hypothetical protein [Rickettsia felis]
MIRYLIILFASIALIGCTGQKTTKSKEVVELDGDPSYAIMKTIDNTNRNIANTTSSLPSTPVR